MSVAHCDASSWCLSRSLMGKKGVLDCLSRFVMVAYQTAYYALSYYGTISVTVCDGLSIVSVTSVGRGGGGEIFFPLLFNTLFRSC